jgi:hypothetical protein
METISSILIFIVIVVIFFAFYKGLDSISLDKEIKTVDKLPASVQNLVKKMNDSDKKAFLIEFNQRQKSTLFSYLLWPLGGLYYAYNKKIGMQFILWLTALVGIGFIWWIIDLFRIPGIVESANNQIAREIAQTLSLGKSFEKDGNG